MSKAPSMPMFWDAYLADTTHLSTEEHGAYLLLLAAMWRRNGSVPDDDKDNARILGLTPAKWKRIKQRLASFLVIEDGEISQKYLRKIWENTQEKIEKNRQNGARGGRPTSNKSKDLDKADGSVSVKRNQTIPEPEPDPDKKEDTNVSSKSRTRKKPKTPLKEGWTLPKAWGDWALSEGWPEATIRNEAARFYDYWFNERRGETKADWQATWRNWMRKVSKAPVRTGNVTPLNADGRRWTLAAMERRMDRMDELRREQGFDG